MTDAMPIFDWYAVGEFDDLQQGDLFPLCPIVLPEPSVFQSLLTESVGPETAPQERADASSLLVVYANVIVMSQSCDLAKPDCTQVLVCPHQDAANFSKERRTEIAKDRYAALHMIEACSHADLTFPKQVLDFRTVYGVPKEFLLALAKARGKRARLLPPYREHMAQAFARYFMRVGLPRNLTPES